MPCARSAAWYMIFFGTQPTLTQVPPSATGLRERDARAVLRRALRAGEAAAAAADHEEIPVLSHRRRPAARRPDDILDPLMAWIIVPLLAALAAAAVTIALAVRRGLFRLRGDVDDAWRAFAEQIEKRQAHVTAMTTLCSRLMRYEQETLDRVTETGRIAHRRRRAPRHSRARGRREGAACRGRDAARARRQLPAVRERAARSPRWSDRLATLDAPRHGTPRAVQRSRQPAEPALRRVPEPAGRRFLRLPPRRIPGRERSLRSQPRSQRGRIPLFTLADGRVASERMSDSSGASEPARPAVPLNKGYASPI